MQKNWGQTTFTCNRVQAVYKSIGLAKKFIFDLKVFGEGYDSPKN